MTWSAPAQVSCGEYVSQLTVHDAGTGLVVLSGLMSLSYTRTWDEVDPAGIPRQVWRFVAKADLSAPTGGPISPCVQPSCITPAGPHPTSFYYGYLDYAGCSAAGPWENALVLYHACDRFIHAPGLSDRPGVFHPTVSHALVAPHSALQPFVPSSNIATGGPLISEATRTVVPGTACVVEDKLAGGDLTKLGAGCLCTLTPFPKRDTLRRFAGTTGCGSAWTSLDILFPTLPWLHVVATSIGNWTNPSVYPGDEVTWVDEGLFVHQDACSGSWVELKYGGSTAKGWDAILHSGVTTQNFLDLADNYTAPVAGPHPLPILGSVRPTDHLVYVNFP
jgi:hypothetical protein